ncbi:MAG: hypothetical protein ACM3JH_09535 [Acidithiobacillales bacterium]
MKRAPVVAATFVLVLLAVAAAPVEAQVVIRVSDVVSLRFGAFLQAQADWLEQVSGDQTATSGSSQNLFLRRARFLFGGRLAREIFFYMDTDNSRLGFNKTGSSALGQGFQLLDAFGEWRIGRGLVLDGGLLSVPYSREAMTSSATEFFFDASAYASIQQSATQSTGGNRDTGFLARGYVLDERLEYRLGVFAGYRSPASNNPLRVSGRLQWEFLDRETMYSPEWIGSTRYRGCYLTEKRVLAMGAAFDVQMGYRYSSGDLFAAIPAGPGSVQGKFQYQYVDGGTTFTAIPRQNTEQVDLGYYIKGAKLAPAFRWEQRTVCGQPGKGERRFGAGLNYYPYGMNFNIKAVYLLVDPRSGVRTNEFGIQLQLYYW